MLTDRLFIKYCGEQMYLFRHKLKFLSFLMCALALFSLSGCKAEEAINKAPLKSPLSFMVVDMDGDGFEFIPLEESNVYFDVDDDGFAERTEWVHPDDGFLIIRSHEERMNLSSPLDSVKKRQTGLITKLQDFDKNSDGKYNQADFIDGGRSGMISELNIAIIRDEKLSGLPELKKSLYKGCRPDAIDFQNLTEIKISCGEKVYLASEVVFEYQDENIVWKRMCNYLEASSVSDLKSREDYANYCIK